MHLQSTTPRYEVALLWNNYFPEVLLFVLQNELALRQETSNGLFF